MDFLILIMRDKNYFEEYIKLNNRSISRGGVMLQNGKVAGSRINHFKEDIFIKK